MSGAAVADRLPAIPAAMTAVSRGQTPINSTPAQNRFEAALDNDLNTLGGIAALLNLADEIILKAPGGYDVAAAQEKLRQMGAVFGLRLDAETAEERVIMGWDNHLRQFTENN